MGDTIPEDLQINPPEKKAPSEIPQLTNRDQSWDLDEPISRAEEAKRKEHEEKRLEKTRENIQEIKNTIINEQIDPTGMNAVLDRFTGQESTDHPEAITNKRVRALELVRKRPPETIRQNYERAMTAIDSEYLKDYLDSQRGISKLVPRSIREKRALGDLEKKSTAFEKDFDMSVFKNIVHGTSNDLGETVELKSSDELRKEKGAGLGETDKFVSSFDYIMGNADYIFANSALLTSRSFSGPNVYQIENEEGYVVPMDIADFRPSGKHFNAIVENYNPNIPFTEWHFTGDMAALNLELYGANIYAIPDFKKLFAKYNAALFNTPLEAINFYRKFDRIFMNGNVFSSIESGGKWPNMGNGEMTNEEQKIAEKMVSLYSECNIHPPATPEFQFKKKVPAKKIDFNPDEIGNQPLDKLS